METSAQPQPRPASLGQASSRLALLADGTRMRLLALLDREELTVSELTRSTGLPQSRVSTHLGRLREAGMLRVRREGTSTYYSLCPDLRRDPLWHAVRATLSDPTLADDQRRLAEVLEARAAGASWADAVAGRMEHHYSPGRTWEATARALLGLLDLGDVLDVGTGRGQLPLILLELGRATSVHGFDWDADKIAAAQAAAAEPPALDARFEVADMTDRETAYPPADTVLLVDVIHYLTIEQQDRVLARAAAAVRPGGRLLLREADSERGWRSAVTLAEERLFTFLRFNRGAQVTFRPAREIVARLEDAGLSCRVEPAWGSTPFSNVLIVAHRRG